MIRRLVLVALLGATVPANATNQAGVSINSKSQAYDNCVDLHDTLFLIALGGSPVEPMADLVEAYQPEIMPEGTSDVLNHTLRSIYAELGRANLFDQNPRLEVSRDATCVDWFVKLLWR